jgi:bacteriocin biosynthesis cyclodehydratase domain-containing protein
VRVFIKPGLRRVWRESGSLQIGLSRRRGTVISGLGPAEVRLLERLGAGAAREPTAGLGADPGGGGDQERGQELLDLLTEADVLVSPSGDPPEGLNPDLAERAEADRQVWSVVHGGPDDGWSVMAARATYRVLVAGSGRVAQLLARTLAEAGIGQLLTAATVAEGLAEAAGLPAASGRSGPPGPSRAGEPLDVAVLVEHGVADAEAAGRLVSADVPHLSVVVREDDVVVGPFVRPGRGPCLRCLDLYRGERDPAWPSILAQVIAPGAVRPPPVTAPPEETAVSQLAAGLAALQVLVLLDGVQEPAAAGATLEIELPHGLVAHRSWPAHPACGCHWPPVQAGARSGAQPGRMGW